MKDMTFRSKFMKLGTTARSSWEEIQGQKYYLLTASTCMECWLLQKKNMPNYHLNLEQEGLKGRSNGRPGALVQVLTVECIAGDHFHETIHLIYKITSTATCLQAPSCNSPWVYIWCATTHSCCVVEILWDSWTESRGDNLRRDTGREVGSRRKIKAAVHSRTVEVL